MEQPSNGFSYTVTIPQGRQEQSVKDCRSHLLDIYEDFWLRLFRPTPEVIVLKSLLLPNPQQ